MTRWVVVGFVALSVLSALVNGSTSTAQHRSLQQATEQAAAVTEEKIGDNLVNNAILSVFETDPAVREKLRRVYDKAKGSKVDYTKSRLRRRCTGYFACTTLESFYEIENVILKDGVAYLGALDDRSKADLQQMEDFYHAYQRGSGTLPGMFVHYSGKFDWVTGPKVVLYDPKLKEDRERLAAAGISVNEDGGGVTCGTEWDTTASFLFPWQPINAFHSLNDNSFYILTQIVWQFVTAYDADASPEEAKAGIEFGASHPFASLSEAPEAEGGNAEQLQRIIRHILPFSRTLFMFNMSPQHRGKGISNTFKILRTLFGDRNIHPASEVLRGGPHCLSHVTWGNGYKPFYKDALVEHRKALYRIIHYIFDRDVAVQNALHLEGPVLWSEAAKNTVKRGRGRALRGEQNSSSVPRVYHSGAGEAEAEDDETWFNRIFGANSSVTWPWDQVQVQAPEEGQGRFEDLGEQHGDVSWEAEVQADSSRYSDDPRYSYGPATAAATLDTEDPPSDWTEGVVAGNQSATQRFTVGLGLQQAMQRMRALTGRKQLRVGIMSRNFEHFREGRCLTPASEAAIKAGFEAAGAVVLPCCDYGQVNTVSKAVPYLHDLDICVGIHGAGLINCQFSKNRVVVVEIQGTFGLGFDGFMKGAHMTDGIYVNLDIRHIHHGKGGFELPQFMVENLISLSLELHTELATPQGAVVADPTQSKSFVTRNVHKYFVVYRPPPPMPVTKRSVLGPRIGDTHRVCNELVYVECPLKTENNIKDCDREWLWPPARYVKGCLDPGLLNLDKNNELFIK